MAALRSLGLAVLGFAAFAAAQAGEPDAKARMHSALEAQASLPAEPPRLPGQASDGPSTGRPGEPEAGKRGIERRALDKAAKTHGQDLLQHAKDKALRKVQGGASDAAVGAGRSNVAKEKAKKAHTHKPLTRP